MLKNIKLPVKIKNIKQHINNKSDVYELTGMCYSYYGDEFVYIMNSCINKQSNFFYIKENDLVENFQILNKDKTLSKIEILNRHTKEKNIFKDMSDEEIKDFFSDYKK